MMKKRVLRGLAMGLTLVMLATSSAMGEILRPDSTGDAVVRLQQALTLLGYYSEAIDGEYGMATKRAVTNFQEAFKLKADGKAGSETQYQLMLLTGIKISDSAVPGESTGATGGDNAPDAPAPDASAPDEGDTAPAATGLFGGDYSKLVFGRSGSRVRVLQQALIDLGFEVSKADGVFGTSTYKAVKEFQDLTGLTVDGKAGPATLKQIESYFDAYGVLIGGPIAGSKVEDDENLAYDVPKRTLRPGYSGLDVLYTQDRLKKLGYYKGECDGQYGSGTVAAVQAFQANNGLSVDGKVGSKTRQVLFSDEAFSADEKYPETPGDRVLYPGMSGDDVRDVQVRLKELGYYTKTVDGKYGSGTTAAVKAFQERNGLKADGNCGASTIQALYSSSAVDAGSSVTSPPAYIPVDKPTRVLRPGASGEDVKSVQYQLYLLDYYTGELDGAYGDATVAAVKAFQARNGLTVDGKVGPATADKLYADVAVPADPTVSTPPTAAPTVTPGRTLRLGSKGDDVEQLQTRLTALGYLKGKVDGIFGKATGSALAAFQMRNGLSADGVAGTKTYKKLFSDTAIPSADAEDDSVSDMPTRVLYVGCTGSDVRKVQNRLKTLGYLKDKIDGKYGMATSDAMKAFQQKNGLTVSGMGDTASYQILFSDKALKADDVEGDVSESYTTLRLGASGNAVIRLQQMLSSLKYTVNVNGYYDEATRAAVLAFQQRNGLEADGVAGNLTQTKLYSGNCVTGDTALPDTGTIIGGNGGGPNNTASVKLLHWYDDLKGKLVKNGDTLLIYEPASNSSYYVRVYSCGQHADAEPITKTDTATMKAAWGGKFAWTEKPVYVRLTNGTWCIASTHSMPHEENWIANNDFDGHLCIHFPRTMTECQQNAPENGVRHQNDIRKHWKKLTGETIPW